MRPHAILPRCLSTILCLMVCLSASTARAQDDVVAELNAARREIASLREQLAAKEREVTQLRAEREALVAQLTDARRRLASGGDSSEPSPPGSLERRAPAPDDPFASPESMFHELRKRFEADLAGYPDEQSAPGIGRFKMAVQAWCRRMNRELAQRATWLVEPKDYTELDARRTEVTMRIVDEATGLPIGDPFRAVLSKIIADRMQRSADEAPMWRATVNVQAAPIYRPEHADAGTFDSLLLIGPYAEFAIETDFREISPVRDRPGPRPPPATGGPG
ncbi:MAG: hypothetical protein H6811_06165 [Phycisphaeraceae bacterium]|nr:hypothetical protein [Phycisphaeraceae bacterium]